MPRAYFTRDEILGAHLSLFEIGASVGDPPIVVSDSVLPDFETTPELLADYKIGCIPEAAPDIETESQERYCPREEADGGGYSKATNDIVVADFWDFTLNDFSEPVYRLIFGLPAKIEDGVDQVSYTKSDRVIEAWGVLRLVSHHAGERRALKVLRLQVRMKEMPKFSKDISRPVIRCRVVANSLNGFTGQGIEADAV